MKKVLELFKRKYGWAAVMAVLLSISTTYTLLDAFVIPKSYAALKESPGTAVNCKNCYRCGWTQ